MPTLKARIGGAWVPIAGVGSGADEVFIGSTAPGAGAGYELWVDPTTSTGVQGQVGFVAQHTLTSAFTTTGTHTTLQDEGLTVTISEVALHVYSITASVNVYVPGGANSVTIALLRNGVILRQWDWPSEALATGFAHNFTLRHTYTAAGSASGVVYKLQLQARTTNTSVASYADATNTPRTLVIEDITAVNTLSTNRVICTSGSRPTGLLGLEIYETDTKRELTYDGTTWQITGGSMPKAGLLKNTSVSSGSGWQQIPFTSVEYDTDSLASGSVLTAKFAGMWLVSYRVIFSAVGTANRVVPTVWKNGSINESYAGSSISVAANDDGAIGGAQVVRCAANDTFGLYVYNNVARNYGDASILSRFSITYLGPL